MNIINDYKYKEKEFEKMKNEFNNQIKNKEIQRQKEKEFTIKEGEKIKLSFLYNIF